jgi:diguanylate cyclase (GGDEF)-like protein
MERDDEHPIWRSPQFRVLDDGVANLVRQMVLAMAGMFVAYAAASYLGDQLDLATAGTGFVLRGLIFGAFGSLSIYVTSARPIRAAIGAQRDAIEAREAELRAQSERHRLASQLQDAFDMAGSDVEAYEVVAEALGAVSADPAELLLADSSRAHLRRVAVSPRGEAGCSVETPWDCPAVRRGRGLAFVGPAELDACPKLKARAGEVGGAVCVPVTVLGAPMGVVHVTAAPGRTVEADARAGLETLAAQAGSRIGTLRAMVQSELQATTDPLTGLLNRRSLESELARLRDLGTPFAVAFFDLDHFKQLNDTHGHETGDRALRAFAGLLRRTVRDTDIVCRYGGEEFVVVFPGEDAVSVHPVVMRVAAELAEATRAGNLPEFTVSTGLADSTQSIEVSEVIRLADLAMFRAKEAGRDRVVLAAVPA